MEPEHVGPQTNGAGAGNGNETSSDLTAMAVDVSTRPITGESFELAVNDNGNSNGESFSNGTGAGYENSTSLGLESNSMQVDEMSK
jgi:hypothetical protein